MGDASKVGVLTPRLSAEGREAVSQLGQGKFELTLRFLGREGDGTTSERVLNLRLMADAVHPQLVSYLLQTLPEESSVRLLAGTQLTAMAWHARGDGTADQVDPIGGTLFYRHSAEADHLLAEAAALDPLDPVPWILRVRTGAALGDELSPFRACYERAIHLDPGSWYAHAGFLAIACEKWFGSHDEMFAIARDAARTAPDGDPRHLLICEAHLERWLFFASFDEDAAGASAYLEDSAVRDQVRAALQRFQRAPDTSLDGHLARNAAAAWAYAARDRESLVAAFGELPLYFDRPWTYLGGKDAYREARLWADPQCA